MKRFRFRLQRVLDLRAAREESLQAELAVSTRRYHAENERLAGFMEQRRYAILDRMGMENVGTEGIQIQECAAYIAVLEGQIERQKTILADARAVLEAKRAELLEASRDRKVLDRLRAVKRDRHRAEVGRREQRAENEVAIMQFARGQAGSSALG